MTADDPSRAFLDGPEPVASDRVAHGGGVGSMDAVDKVARMILTHNQFQGAMTTSVLRSKLLKNKADAASIRLAVTRLTTVGVLAEDIRPGRGHPVSTVSKRV